MKEEERVYRITGLPRQLDRLEQIFCYIQFLGNIGHSTSFELFVDGDGAARMKFRTEDNQNIRDINNNGEKIREKMDTRYNIKSFVIE